ncbi:uncharacterized protein LOC143343486 [Colletes latitarsis]|uniref:uncharacterized protein LOC143343486 n=1 Tax=Colletes latitarsis TaxID=2605962 RepID=UPI00403671BF
MQPSILILFVLFSTLSGSTTNRETLDATKNSTNGSSLSMHEQLRGDSTRNENSITVETLFVPEDTSRYAAILNHARKLISNDDSTAKRDLEETGGNAENTTREALAAGKPSKGAGSEFSKLDELEGGHRSPSPPNEKKYLLRENSGEVPSGTTAGNNGYETKSLKSGNHREEKIKPNEDDLLEAANFGLEAMKNLYLVTEPTLYSMGIYLDSDNPARYVAAFNDQTEEARTLAQYGFAVLQGATMFKKKFPAAAADLLLSRRSKNNPLQRQCPNRGVPDCPPASLRYRTSDGSCNNLQNLWWGSAMSAMQRFLPPAYGDGIQSVRRSVSGRPLPSARQVTAVIHEDKDIPLASITHMLMQWGQFVDHDMTATGQSRGFNGTVPQCCLNFGTGFQPPEFMHPECLPIVVSSQDSFFGPLDVKCLEFLRSGSAPSEDCEFGPREQLSQVTSYLDASTVYSSNAFHTDGLRLFRNGLLQYGKIESQRPLLPRQDPDLCRRGSLSTSCFRAGDGRLGEQPALTSLHVVFLRLHNRLATKLAALNPHWGDEKLFQESRRIVGAIVQHITYREFLPIVLGQDVMKIFGLEVLKKGYYEAYDPTLNPTVANEFSSAAYRFGHSLVQHSFVRFDSDHQPIFNNVTIHKEFSNPANLETVGSVDRLLLGLINQPSQKRDEYITEELTNHLFQTPSFPFGMDLASINIQRGRDHGIPPYVKWREPCGLSPIKSFEDLDRVMPPSTARKFKLVYSFVEDIDLFTAGLAEKSVSGGLVGPTFACIIGQQFSNLRRGDRFWYENSGHGNSFTPGQLQQLRRVSLAQILCTTMDDIETIQPFVFLTQDTLRNQRVTCNDPTIGQLSLEFWEEGSFERSRLLSVLKRKTTQATTPKITTPSIVEQQKKISLKVSPSKPAIHQQNRIVVKRPLGRPDNVSIVVQNNAVNAPIYVNDAIYGSDIKMDSPMRQNNDPKPIYIVLNNRPTLQNSLQPVPAFPPTKPLPTTYPSVATFTSRPYVPHAFNDPYNPNPLSHRFQPVPQFGDVLFERHPATSPRPTLYTYYTSFERTTQRPQHDSANYDSSKIIYDALGNQELTDWQRLQQQQHLVHQLNNPGHWNSQGYQNRPTNPTIDQLSKDSAEWNSQNDRYGSSGGYQGSNRPPYQTQSSRRPIQSDFGGWPVTPVYQKESEFTDRPPNSIVTNPNNLYSKIPYGGPVLGHDLEASGYQDSSRPPYQAQSSRKPIQPDFGGWPVTPVYQKGSEITDRPPTSIVDNPNNLHSKIPYGGPVLGHDLEVSGYQHSSRPPYQAQSSRKPIQPDFGGWPVTPVYQKGSEITDRPPTSIVDNPNNLHSKIPYGGPVLGHDLEVSGYQHSSRPPYQAQSSRKPIQPDFGGWPVTPVYQKGSEITDRPPTSIVDNPNNLHSKIPYGGPVLAHELEVSGYQGSSRPHTQNGDSFHSTPLVYGATSRPFQDQLHTSADSYQNHVKPSKVHSVTIVTETRETMNQDRSKIDSIENQVTTEVPKPLVSWVNDNKHIIRRPGQFYYEKNVLHRYPDKIDDQATIRRYHLIDHDVEQRHKANVEESVDKSIIDDSAGNTKVDKIENGTMIDAVTNLTRNETNDGLQSGNYDLRETISEGIENVSSTDRRNFWLNPQEDSSLTSALEMPKVPSDDAMAAKELPKPIKRRSYAS